MSASRNSDEERSGTEALDELVPAAPTRGLHGAYADPAQYQRIGWELLALMDVDHVVHVHEFGRRVVVEVRDDDGAAFHGGCHGRVVGAHAGDEERGEERGLLEVIVDGDVREVPEEVQAASEDPAHLLEHDLRIPGGGRLVIGRRDVEGVTAP